MDYSKNIISTSATIKDALKQLNQFSSKDNLTLFVVNNEHTLVGTLTDGDIRRSFLDGYKIESPVEEVMHKQFKFLQRNNYTIDYINELRKKTIDLVPLLDSDFRIEKIINLNKLKSVLPLDAVIMAGGEGKRLLPLTQTIPKPLLFVGDKPIIEHNIDRLIAYGIDTINITIKYLGTKIIEAFGNGQNKNVSINYTQEEASLGTIGALSLVDKFKHNHILIMNSDLLTNIDYEDFYKTFINSNADMAVATIPYQVTLPYGVIESDNGIVNGIKEKPTYTYYSNAGIYLLKKELLDYIPKNSFYNATDLIQTLIDNKKIITSYPILSYWLDIGRHDDYIKAQEDIKHLKF